MMLEPKSSANNGGNEDKSNKGKGSKGPMVNLDIIKSSDNTLVFDLFYLFYKEMLKRPLKTIIIVIGLVNLSNIGGGVLIGLSSSLLGVTPPTDSELTVQIGYVVGNTSTRIINDTGKVLVPATGEVIRITADSLGDSSRAMLVTHYNYSTNQPKQSFSTPSLLTNFNSYQDKDQSIRLIKR